jgi:hypothetical protein
MVDLREAVIEVERELTVRQNIYPKLVDQGKLTEGEARRRMRTLRGVLDLLDEAWVKQKSTTPTTRE